MQFSDAHVNRVRTDAYYALVSIAIQSVSLQTHHSVYAITMVDRAVQSCGDQAIIQHIFI